MHQRGGSPVNTSSWAVQTKSPLFHSHTGWHLKTLENSLAIDPERNWEKLVAPKPGGSNGRKPWSMLATCFDPDTTPIGSRHGLEPTSFLSNLKMAIDSW